MNTKKHILKPTLLLILIIVCALKCWYFGVHKVFYTSIVKDQFLDTCKYPKFVWVDLLSNHPYNVRKPIQNYRKVAKNDRPDLAMEQKFLMTMDPSTGSVPSERLQLVRREIDRLSNSRSPIADVNWEERGPINIGGRTRALVFDPNDINKTKVWAGGVAGGLWFTNDITAANPVWTHVDGLWDNIAISSIAFNPANTQEMYVGTGEGWFNADGLYGGGIWKSSDGGNSWANLVNTIPGGFNSSSNFHFINKIVIKNDGTVFLATRGYFTNRGGILRSTNGGSTWSKVLTVYTGTGGPYDWAADLEIAVNGDIYASFGIKSQGRVYKSTDMDNGAIGTWTDLSTAIGVTNAKRIELACAPSNPNVIYAVAQGGTGDKDIEWFKKSMDAGVTWVNITIPLMVDASMDHFTRSQAWYDLILTIHPTNPNLIIAGGVDLHRSLDGGSTWTGISHWYGGFGKPFVHADQHIIQFRPGFSNHAIFGNDGGVYFSDNVGNNSVSPSFSSKNSGYNVTQFYACATKNEINSHYFLAGSQDNGTQKFTTPQLNSTIEVSGGDGGFCHVDQSNSLIQTSSYTYNNIFRYVNGGTSWTKIISQESGQFINPSEYDSQRKILYSAAANDSMKIISTFNGAFTNGDLYFNFGNAQISFLKLSPYNDVLFAGIENGRIYKIGNASQPNPILIRIDESLPTNGWVSSIDVGADDNHILISFSNYGVTSVWETSNGGVSWINKEGNLPDMPIRSVLYNPNNRNQVMVATEMGVWTTDNFQPTTNDAPVWGPSNLNLANTRCNMLKYRSVDKVVVVATHGRGLFTSDIFVDSPIADFTSDINTDCAGTLTVNFTDNSLKANNSWEWDINDDGIVDYTSRNPTHTYTSPGLYSVKLTIDNGSTTIVKKNNIFISLSGPLVNTSCSVPSNSNLNNIYGIGIRKFALADLTNITPNDNGSYNDYTCSKWANLSPNNLYNITVSTGTFNSEGAKVYIDYNNNGQLESIEEVVSFPTNNAGERTLSFTTPSSDVVEYIPLRLRVVSKYFATISSPCDNDTYGQIEDYTVVFSCTNMVTNSADNGPGSLRYIVNCASDNDTITFDDAILPQFINLTSGSIVLNKNIHIVQPINKVMKLRALNNGPVFDIAPNKTVWFENIDIYAGTNLNNRALLNYGNLTMKNVIIHENLSTVGTGSTFTNLGNVTFIGNSKIVID